MRLRGNASLGRLYAGALWGLTMVAISLAAPRPLWAASPGDLASAPGQHPKREDLIGAWRLVELRYSGPGGKVDPFYQPGSTGLIVYDASGWMSVQITAPHRASFEVPGRRGAARQADARAAQKAAGFDSYYAYFGTWDFDPIAATVTHHVRGALLESENGVDYTQSVRLEAGRLVFTTRAGPAAREVVRMKIWERANRSADSSF